MEDCSFSSVLVKSRSWDCIVCCIDVIRNACIRTSANRNLAFCESPISVSRVDIAFCGSYCSLLSVIHTAFYFDARSRMLWCKREYYLYRTLMLTPKRHIHLSWSVVWLVPINLPFFWDQPKHPKEKAIFHASLCVIARRGDSEDSGFPQASLTNNRS